MPSFSFSSKSEGDSFVLTGYKVANTTFSYTFIGLGWPLNFHFMFDLMVLSAAGIFLLSFFMPKSIELKRKASPSDTVSAETSTETVEVDGHGLTSKHSNDSLASSTHAVRAQPLS